MNPPRLAALAPLVFSFAACGAPPATQEPAAPVSNQCRYLGEVVGGDGRHDALKMLHAQVHQDVLLLGTSAFACPCGDPRQIGGDSEAVRLGGAAETAHVGGVVESTKVAGAGDQAHVAGASEAHRVGGADERVHVAGATEDAHVAGTGESARVEGDAEGARVAGATEQRRIAGADEGALVGGVTSDVVCTRGAGPLGYELSQRRSAAPILFDGDLLWTVEPSGLVLVR